MVDIGPNTALLISLGNAYNAARANAPRGNPTAGIPGITAGIANGEAGSTGTPGIGPSGGVPGGSVPGTATTGDAVVDAIMGGEASVGDPVAQSVARSVFGRNEGGERGDLGAGVTGGDVGTLLSVLTGPGAMFSMLPSLVASDALGLDLDPNLLSMNSLIELAQAESDAGEFGTGRAAATLEDAIAGAAVAGAVSALGPNTATGGGITNFGREESEIDRGGGPGAGPSRGAAGAGNRGR